MREETSPQRHPAETYPRCIATIGGHDDPARGFDRGDVIYRDRAIRIPPPVISNE